MTMTTQNRNAVPLSTRIALRREEAANALGISLSEFQRWADEANVPRVRRGRITLYPVDGLKAWFAAQLATDKTPAGQEPDAQSE